MCEHMRNVVSDRLVMSTVYTTGARTSKISKDFSLRKKRFWLSTLEMCPAFHYKYNSVGNIIKLHVNCVADSQPKIPEIQWNLW